MWAERSWASSRDAHLSDCGRTAEGGGIARRLFPSTGYRHARGGTRFGQLRTRPDAVEGAAPSFSVAHDMRTAPSSWRRETLGCERSGPNSASGAIAPYVQVILVQGVVTVSSRATVSAPKRAWTLKAGQQLIADGAVSGPSAVDVALATDWLQNRLVFRDLPLREAIAEVNRYTPDKVVLEAPDAGATPSKRRLQRRRSRLDSLSAAADVCGLDVHPGTRWGSVAKPQGHAADLT